MYDPHGNELSGERGTSTAFSGEGEKPSHVVAASLVLIESRSGIMINLEKQMVI